MKPSYVESFGTGMQEILRLCKEAGLAEPVFDVGKEFKISIWRPKVINLTKSKTTHKVTGQATDQVHA